MSLDRIQLSDFRNHRETRLEGAARFNLLVGENGAGKTNVLEAISLLAPGRGIRRAKLDDMPAQEGEGGFAISADLIAGDEPVRLGTGIKAAQPGKRIIQINQTNAPAIRLAEWLSIGWLTPAMDRLFAEGAGARRRFIDRMVLAVSPGHAKSATRLENALRERNRLLSEPHMPEAQWFDAIEAQIAEAGSAVATERQALVRALDDTLAALPDGPFARPSLRYEPGGPVTADALAASLLEMRGRDRAAQRTLTGPHRDEIAVHMIGKSGPADESQPAAECSTGEQKAMLIAIVLAHSQLLETARPEDARPRLLLLDEVAAHLDPVRREALFDRLRGGQAQIWLTGTELAPFAAIKDEAAVWDVHGGTVERIR